MNQQLPIERKVKWYASTAKHYEKVIDGKPTFLVRSFFTSDNPDQIGDIITKEATVKASEKWRNIANIRYMHQPEPIGKAVRIGEKDGLAWNEVECKIVDPKSQNLIREGVLGAMSVGIIVNDAEPADPDNKDPYWFMSGGMKIVDYDLVEISMVDHPMNLDAMVTGMPGQVTAQQEGRQYVFKSINLDELVKKGDGPLDALNVDNTTHIEEEISTPTADKEQAYGSDFPDAAFAVVENTGEKDDVGTVPKDARHLPHHTKEVKDPDEDSTVDLSHYRNALARANQIKPVTNTISQEELVSKAQAHLDKHKDVLGGDKAIELLQSEVAWGDFIEKYKSPDLDNWRKFVDEVENKGAEQPEAAKEEPPQNSDMAQMMSMMQEMIGMMKNIMDTLKDDPDEELAAEPETVKSEQIKEEPKPETPKEEPVVEQKAVATEVAKANSESDLVTKLSAVVDKSLEAFLVKANENTEAKIAELKNYIEELRTKAQPSQAQMKTNEPPEEDKKPTDDELMRMKPDERKAYTRRVIEGIIKPNN